MENIEKCECYIGVLYSDENDLVTFDELKRAIKRHNEDIDYWKHHGISSQRWEVKDFCDFNMRCGFLRFMYCPKCGNAINWIKLKGGANG